MIEVQPARSQPAATWLDGDSGCPHTVHDILAQYSVCRDCGAYTLEQAAVPEAFLAVEQRQQVAAGVLGGRLLSPAGRVSNLAYISPGTGWRQLQ